MSSPFWILPFLLLMGFSECAEKEKSVLISKEDIIASKSKTKLEFLSVSMRDLLPESKTPKWEEEVPRTLGEAYVPEKIADEIPELVKDKFDTAISFARRGRGRGSSPQKKSAFKLLEDISDVHPEAEKLVAYAHLFGDHSRWSVDEAKNTFEKLAGKGSPDSQLALGFMHATGVGMEKSDQAKAIVHYMFAALGGSPLAQMAMGYRYYYGIGVPQNCQSALSFYERVARTVVDNVRYSTGITIQRTRLIDEANPTITPQTGSTPMDENLLEYYRMVADKGDVQAQIGLGQIYLNGGRGVEQDFEAAYRYFTLASETGNSNANAYLGKMYLDGTPVTPADNRTAFYYFLKASDKGNAAGFAGLGIMYIQGRGVRKDYEKAFKLLSIAAEQSNPDGQLYLGKMHFDGIPLKSGKQRDYLAAIKYFQLASQNGNILGFYNLAQIHSTGIGVQRSCIQAVELLKNVAERGKWGERLMEAYSAFKNDQVDEAAIKYMFMAELGYEVAQTNLAFILDKGLATSLFNGPKEATLKRAFTNWQRAANQEYPIARVKLGDYYYYGLGTDPDHTLAFTNYKTAADRHHVAQAMFNLGYMHEVGEGITKDLHLAKRFYDLAIEHSTDALVPCKMALAKLHFVFLLETFNENPLIQFVESIIGPSWDVLLMVLLVSIPAAILIFGPRPGILGA